LVRTRSLQSYDRVRHLRHLRVLLVVALLALAVWVALGIKVFSIGRDVWTLYQDVQQLRDLASEPEVMLSMLPVVRQDVSNVFDSLSVPVRVAARLGALPVVGPTLESIPAFVSTGQSLLEVGFLLAEISADPAGDLLSGQSTLDESVPALFLAWRKERNGLQQVAARASADLAQIAALDASELVRPLRGPVTTFQALEPLLSASLEAIPGLLELIERPGERVLLLLAQNSDELRATGGYISSFGILTLEDGVPVDFSLVDADRLEDWTKPHPEPPEPLREYMDIDLWVTRDGNWWPDFTRSAEAVADLYTLNHDVPVDTVVAVDFAGAVRLLEALAPLRLSDGRQLEGGEIAEGLRASWGLPRDALLVDPQSFTASRPFSYVDVEISFCDKVGDVWFDSVRLEVANGPGVNLVRNPSFELDADGDGLPDEWELNGLSAGDHLVQDVAQSGSASLHLVGEPGVEKRIVQRIPYRGEAGDVLEYIAYSRTSGVLAKGGSYVLAIRLIGEDGDVEQSSAAFASLTHDWATSGTASVIGEWWSGRKDFIGEAIDAALAKMISQPRSVAWPDVLVEAVSLLDERHVQVYSDVASLQQVARERGWAGEMGDVVGDYLCVVDSNMGYNKVSASVEQSIHYEVDLDEATCRARLAVEYVNTSPPEEGECDKYKQYEPSYESLSHGCYWDYVRVYVPRGATLRQGSGGDAPVLSEDDGAWTVFSTYLVLEPGERRTIAFDYLLPDGVIQAGGYTLCVRKQAGTDALPLSVRVASGTPIVSLTEEMRAEKTASGDLEFVTDLRVDRVFRVGPE